MKLTLRFVVLVLALLAAAGASAVAGWRALERSDRALQRVADIDMERLLAITHTRRLFRSMVVLERDVILAQSEAERAALASKLVALSKDLDQQLDKYERKLPGEDRQALADILVLEVSDDGPGIDGERLRQRAQALGLGASEPVLKAGLPANAPARRWTLAPPG